jgi:hypothetical protein
VFKINKKIDNPADCEVRSVICFLKAQNVRAIDIHRQLTAVYGEGVRRLRYAIQNRRRGLLSSGVMLLHDNARQHAAARMQVMLQEFGWEVFEHPAYSPDLVQVIFTCSQN